jgi:hypothetical protein
MALVTQNILSLSRLHSDLSYDQGGLNLEADSVPDGYPVALTTNLTWNGAGLIDDNQYTYFLTKDEILEIEAALAAFKGMQSQLTRQPHSSST